MKKEFQLSDYKSEKATKVWEISIVDFSYTGHRYVVPVKCTEEISQNFVAFSEYMYYNHLLNPWEEIHEIIVMGFIWKIKVMLRLIDL